MKRFEEIHIQNMISWNKNETARRKESFGVKIDLLNEIIDRVNQLSTIEDDDERILQQASLLVGLIVFEQPFNNANKATSTASMINFLRLNGYELDLRSETEQDKLLQILNDIMYLFEGESQRGVITVKEFLKRHVKKQ